MVSRYNAQSVQEATTVDAKSDDGKEADLKSKTTGSRFSSLFLVVCGLFATAIFLAIDAWFPLLFLAVFWGVPTSFLVYAVRVEHRDYSHSTFQLDRMVSRYCAQFAIEATTSDGNSDDGKEATGSRFSLFLVVCGLFYAAMFLATLMDYWCLLLLPTFLIVKYVKSKTTGSRFSLGSVVVVCGIVAYLYFLLHLDMLDSPPWYGIWCPLLFVAVFWGLPTFLVVKYVEHRDYSDFDVIVWEVARMVMLPEKTGTESPLEIPLLLESPPSSRTYRVQNKPCSILHRKSGKVLLSGSSVLCDLRLIFTESGPGGFSIQGSTVFENGTTTFVIQEGFFSTVCLKIYWDEASSDGLRRVVTGTFQDDFASFSGEWCASDGTRGALAMI